MSSKHVSPNFVTEIIDHDLDKGHVSRVATRFPPEPNGYLHIGHAKSICLNFGLAEDYHGTCFMRFDDTNPTTEEVEYVTSIQNDVKWLGWHWDGPTRFASDYFDWMYELAEGLILDGKAYVDSQSIEAIRENRGSATEPGVNSPFRDRSVEENLQLFRQMKAGVYPDGSHVLRAKIDMNAANILMRDPLLYRIRHSTHHRTGDQWCIYPIYDYAHCLEDAYEKITHSLCTLEFENNRELYDWVIENTRQNHTPHQYEFARLNLTYTVMSKRKFIKLVDGGYVSGWDDPRLPTLAGLRRRGVRPEAIREFCNRIGLARANSTVDLSLLEFCIRDDLNMLVRRVMAVLRPLKVTITNWDEHHQPSEVEWLEASYFPHDVPQVGQREIPIGKTLYIERDDFEEHPPKGYYRLAPGQEVRLRYGYYITCQDIIKNDEGEVIEVLCTYDPESKGGETPDGRKVKGTIHWVSAEKAVPAEFRLYDRLFLVENPGSDPDTDFVEELNPNSLEILHGFVEPSLATEPAESRFQFERQGYFFADPLDHRPPDALVFNRIVTLRDSWAKKEKPKSKILDEVSKPKSTEQNDDNVDQNDQSPKPAVEKRPANYYRVKARDTYPSLHKDYEQYMTEYKLSEKDADLLAGDLKSSAFFKAVLEEYRHPVVVAKWLVNDLLHRIQDEEDWETLSFGPKEVASLVALIDTSTITAQSAEIVRDQLFETGGDPEAIVDRLGLRKLDDEDAVQTIVEQVMQANPKMVEKYLSGTDSLVGFFIGQVMKETKGSADGALVRRLVNEALERRQKSRDQSS